jgi:predicted lipoprotein with Yx(FWY)xxD motif
MMNTDSGGDMRTKPHQERTDMTKVPTRRAARRIPLGRVAGAALAAGGLAVALIAAGTAGAATSSMVSTAQNAKYGTILVSGRTVYTLKASKTACGAGCLKIWPELMLPKGVTRATAGPGVNAAKLGTIKRKGGALQVTYGGRPLYFFALDKGPGQVNGNLTDKWGAWAVVVTAKPTGSSSNSGSGTGSGSGSGGSAGTGGVSF